LRVGGHTFITGLQPGAIISPGVAEAPNAPQVNRVWRYRSDWQTADLTSEALDILFSQPGAADKGFQFSQEQVNTVADSLRLGYEKDFNEWPWQKGAPFYDLNGNGIMDEGEEPGLLNADQVVWFVANDLNPELTQNLFGSPPIGVEMQVTLWAYKDDMDLENTIFRRVRLIYKGTSNTPTDATIDSMALGLYSEVDLGYFADDFAGTDTTLNMIFAYNSTTLDSAYQKFNSSPPAVGYMLLQGPIVPSANENDVARFDFSERRGYRNLPMTGSWIDAAGDVDSQPSRGVYDGTLQYYNVLNGFRPRPENPPNPFIDPTTGKPTRFSRTGDPVTNTGWVDANPGNRQMTLTTANFNMALGDTQEVIIAMTAGLGADRLASVDVMKFFARKAREFALSTFVTNIDNGVTDIKNAPDNFQLYQNFPNPFNPSTEIRYDLLGQTHVTLTIYNLLGERIGILVDSIQNRGSYGILWDGTDAHGQIVPSGIYFYQIEAGGFNRTKKMVIVR
jgi:hypothetical protein